MDEDEIKEKLVERLIIAVMIIIMIALVIFFLTMPADSQEIKEQLRLDLIVVYPGDKIELYYNNGDAVKTFFGGYRFETITNAIGEADTIYERNGRRYLVYSNLQITFVVDDANLVQQIEIWNSLVKTVDGLAFGDGFNKAIKAYGKPDEDYNPYNVPNQPSLSNNRLMVYKKLGILFYGTINPNQITCTAIFSPK